MASGLTDPGGYTFAAGQFKDASDTTYGINLGASQFTEIEFAVRATASATGGGDYCFRLYDATSGAALNTYTNYGAARVLGVTAIDLLSFAAAGEGEAVRIVWETAQESDNKGFRLLRAQTPLGPYIPMHEGLITSASIGGEGRRYEFVDHTAVPGLMYYYKLEDVDVSGTRDAARSGVRGLGRGRDSGRLGDCLRAEPGGERRESGQRRGRGGRTGWSISGAPTRSTRTRTGTGSPTERRRRTRGTRAERQQPERGCECAGARLRQPWDDRLSW